MSIRPSASDPSALERLREVAAAYRGLAAYTDEGALSLTFEQGGQPRALTLKTPLRFRRPGRLVWDGEITAVIAEGDRVIEVNPGLAAAVRCDDGVAVPATDRVARSAGDGHQQGGFATAPEHGADGPGPDGWIRTC